jgi:predicted RNase H-like HicB family nuclease
MKYSVILEPQEEGGYTVRCLELPSAISQGETKTEALENIKEAIGLILEVHREDLESLNRTNAEMLKVELADVF